MYWIFRNLAAFLLSIPCDFIYLPVVYYRRLSSLTKSHDSERISFPWEWNWRLAGHED